VGIIPVTSKDEFELSCDKTEEPLVAELIVFNSFVKRTIMDQTVIKNIILNHLKQYNPVKIGIFGSFARGENKKGSDIDILIEFRNSPSLLTLIRLENELTDIIGVKVDLVTTGAIKNKRIRKSIKEDLIKIL